MRLWIVVVLACVALPALALAKPKVAVAPLENDDEGKVSSVVAAETASVAKVTSPKATGKEIDSLGISDLDSKKSLKKLRTKLEVDAVIHGKVTRSGSKKMLVLQISGRKRSESIELTFKPPASKAFKKQLREALADKISGAEGDGAEDDDDDKPPPEEKKKPVFGGDDAAEKPIEKKKPDPEPEKVEKKKVASRDTSDDDSDKVTRKSKKKKKHKKTDDGDDSAGGDDDVPDRHPVTQAAVWLDGGAVGLHRTLTYDSPAGPPPVGTASFGGAIEAELYPGSFDTLKGAAAGIGIAATAEKSVGLSIQIPGSTQKAAIDEMQYSVGARYRFIFGQSSVALGVSYWKRAFIATVPAGATLDMPNVNYTGVAPVVAARFAASPKLGISLTAQVPLMLGSGDITNGMNFGKASIIAFGGEGAVDYALAPHYGLRFAALFDQVGLGFQATKRTVTSATDRSLGIIATFAVLY